ncbi:MAG: oligosaccharide flippase family protein, partial [Vampirovibrionales bacterium]|nr:oligosaccharide flippase family protein [Vampirovibrionales bacterium]
MPQNSTLAKTPFLLGLLSGAGGVVAKTLINTVTIPVLLQTQGADGFGLYVLLISLLELGLMLELGFDSAITKLLVELRQLPDKAHYAFMLRSAHGLYCVVACVVLLAGFALSATDLSFFHIPANWAKAAQYGTALIAIEAALTLYLGYHRTVLLSHGQLHWTNWGELLSFVLAPGLGLITLLNGHGIIVYLWIRLAVMIARAALVIYQAKRFESSDMRPTLHRESFIRVFKLGVHGMVINLSVLVSHKIDNLIIAAFLPLKALGVFEIVFRFLGVALRFGSKLCEGLVPVFSQLSGTVDIAPSQTEKQSAKRYFLLMSGLNSLMAGALCLLVVWYYPTLFTWVSRDQISIEETWPIVWAAVPIVISGTLQMPATHYLFTSGFHRFLSITSVFAACSNLLLSILLIKPFGLLGVALGTLIPQLIQHQFFLIRKTCT